MDDLPARLMRRVGGFLSVAGGQGKAGVDRGAAPLYILRATSIC